MSNLQKTLVLLLHTWIVIKFETQFVIALLLQDDYTITVSCYN